MRRQRRGANGGLRGGGRQVNRETTFGKAACTSAAFLFTAVLLPFLPPLCGGKIGGSSLLVRRAVVADPAGIGTESVILKAALRVLRPEGSLFVSCFPERSFTPLEDLGVQDDSQMSAAHCFGTGPKGGLVSVILGTAVFGGHPESLFASANLRIRTAPIWPIPAGVGSPASAIPGLPEAARSKATHD